MITRICTTVCTYEVCIVHLSLLKLKAYTMEVTRVLSEEKELCHMASMYYF